MISLSEKQRLQLEKASSIVGALLYISFAFNMLVDIHTHHRISSMFPFALMTLFVIFFLMRGLPKKTNTSLYDWVIAMAGTFLPFFFRPAPGLHDSIPLIIIQLVGLCISIAGVLSLNKSLGLVAANRGIKTEGAYKYVRHPIYAGYFLSIVFYCMQNMTVQNLSVLVAWAVLEVSRIFAEERHLAEDPAYRDYMQKVRWRLFPRIF